VVEQPVAQLGRRLRGRAIPESWGLERRYARWLNAIGPAKLVDETGGEGLEASTVGLRTTMTISSSSPKSREYSR
jgi:hypothetical protein